MPPSGVKLHILTTGGVAIHDTWRWDAGYVGWQYLPKRDLGKEIEALNYINNGVKVNNDFKPYREPEVYQLSNDGVKGSDKEIEESNRRFGQPHYGHDERVAEMCKVLETEYGSTDIIGVVNQWNVEAGRTEGVFNPRQTAFYTGMQCEELAEKLYACGLHSSAEFLDHIGKEMKRGDWDANVAAAKRKDLLDADADIMVVTCGSAQGQGADFKGAMDAVLAANEAKRFPDGTLHKDANGKILKPEGWKAPDLTPYLAKLPPNLNRSTGL
jgi:predicted HAD superfamily Cof-like phosphohydrolase